ncbi:MAG: pyridoxamine 5'-phosphate oxidase family protein [Candidatus Cloacimonetes bacterium]|nr:pyridoxamine 5'-phosphate oxidase family protein [Candidatus Cloacimonadota bacterium]
MISIEEIELLWQDTQVVYLATSSGQQPYVRPVVLIRQNDRFWIATGDSDKKMEQIRKNRRFEFCLPLKQEDDEGSLRVQGNLIIVEDQTAKTMIYQQVPFIRLYWDDPADPSYALLELQFDQLEIMNPGEMVSEIIKL